MTDTGGWDSDETPDEPDELDSDFDNELFEDQPMLHDIARGGDLRALREALHAAEHEVSNLFAYATQVGEEASS